MTLILFYFKLSSVSATSVLLFLKECKYVSSKVWEMDAQKDEVFPKDMQPTSGRTVFCMPSLSPMAVPEASVVTQHSGLD